ncbi:UNVERIFIED_CONTAM: hypothetical protein Sradi_4364500 [Sesamum radiatum]|uniref:GRF-type domain-containing protein n=1 Tax=Sesamum radiatum TaxID=300843 RepID=A0AAW2NN47_SESRA
MQNGYSTNSFSSRTNSGGRSSNRQPPSASSDDVVRICTCGKDVVLRTSWTSINPGRRFRGCPGEEVRLGHHLSVFQGHYCGTFQWVDPPMCHRAKEVISGLLNRLSLLDAVNKRAKERILTEQLKVCHSKICLFVLLSIWVFTLAIAVKAMLTR